MIFKSRRLACSLSQVTQQKIDVQRPFVGLVDDDRIVSIQEPIGLCFGQQDPVGHQFDERLRSRLIAEANLIADRSSERRIEFFGRVARRCFARPTAAVECVRSSPFDQASFQKDLGQLRALAAAGFPAHDHLVLPDQRQQFVTMGTDRQFAGYSIRGVAAFRASQRATD